MVFYSWVAKWFFNDDFLLIDLLQIEQENGVSFAWIITNNMPIQVQFSSKLFTN